jgi:hypothetical protein
VTVAEVTPRVRPSVERKTYSIFAGGVQRSSLGRVRVTFSRSVWVGEADRVAVTYR